jgi:sulfur carrier protein
MNVIVNGQPHDLPAATTVKQLIARHNLTSDKVAVELNRRLLRSSNYDIELRDNDEVEIVTFVGGG